MTTPVTKGGNPSIVARNPINVPCNPAPSMSMPMPSSSGQVENTCRAGNAMPAVYRRTSIDLLTDAWSHVALRSTRAGCQRNAFVTLTNSSRTLLWLSTVSLAEAPSSLRGRGNDHVHNDAAKKSRKTRIHRHPDVGRDPDEESARHCAHRPATLNILRRPGARPGSRHKSGAPLRAKPGLRPTPERRRLESRCLGCGDTQHSPSSRRQAREAWTPAYAGATRMRSVALDLATLNILRRPGARPGSRHKSGAPLRAKPGLRPPPERRRLESRCRGSGDAQHSSSSRR